MHRLCKKVSLHICVDFAYLCVVLKVSQCLSSLQVPANKNKENIDENMKN